MNLTPATACLYNLHVAKEEQRRIGCRGRAAPRFARLVSLWLPQSELLSWTRVHEMLPRLATKCNATKGRINGNGRNPRGRNISQVRNFTEASQEKHPVTS
jgi:hypothetical protein